MSSLSFVLSPPSAPDTHVLPINAIAVSPDGHLFSAGRDGTIVQHIYNSPQSPNIQQNHIQLHSDWINGLTTISSTTVVTGSSDLTVKYWSPDSNSHGLIGYHADYVKAVSSHGSTVYSAGLDSVVKVWDINRCSEINKWTNSGVKSSLYSIKTNKSGVVAVGDLAGNLNLLDGRANLSTISKIQGAHDDAIKSLLINDSYVLSGSSDSTVKLFDLRNSSTAVETFKFDESIWCLESNDESFKSFYAGGSNGNVYHHTPSETVSIHNEPKGILSISKWNGEIFISSMTNSNITNITKPESTIKGQPGLIRAQTLNNRRHVITLSTSNEVMMWDILNLKMIKSFGSDIDFETIISQFQTQEILNSWCRITIKSGKLFIILTEYNWNDCEVYGNLLKDYETSSELDRNVRYSLGKFFLLSIFKQLIKFETENDKIYKDEKSSSSTNSNSKYSKLNILTSKSSSQVNSVPSTPTDTPDTEKKFKFFSKKSRQLSSSNSIPLATPEQQLQTPPQSSQQIILADTSNSAYQAILDIRQQYSQIQSTSLSAISLLTTPTDPYLLGIERLSTLEKEQIQLIISKTIDGNQAGQIDFYSENLNKVIFEDYESLASIANTPKKQEIIDEFTLLEKKLPSWIGNFLFKNKFVVKDLPKVGFLISRDLTDDTVPELKKNPTAFQPGQSQPQGQQQETQSDAANGSTTNETSNTNGERQSSTTSSASAGTAPLAADLEMRLNAYGMLRIRKVLYYIHERFNFDEFAANNRDDDVSQENVEDWLELVCLGEPLDNDLTLATLRSFVWKRGGDVKLSYRRKKIIKDEDEDDDDDDEPKRPALKKIL